MCLSYLLRMKTTACGGYCSGLGLSVFVGLGIQTYNEDHLKRAVSSLMYSRWDRLFYHILQTDKQVEAHNLNNPEFVPKRYKYRRGRFQNIPDSLDSLADKLGPFYRTDYTVVKNLLQPGNCENLKRSEKSLGMISKSTPFPLRLCGS